LVVVALRFVRVLSSRGVSLASAPLGFVRPWPTLRHCPSRDVIQEYYPIYLNLTTAIRYLPILSDVAVAARSRHAGDLPLRFDLDPEADTGPSPCLGGDPHRMALWPCTWRCADWLPWSEAVGDAGPEAPIASSPKTSPRQASTRRQILSECLPSRVPCCLPTPMSDRIV
jgi:hypothetical protein